MFNVSMNKDIIYLLVSKPVIIVDSCVVKSWFTFANLQSASLKLPRPKQLYFILYLECEWLVHICPLIQHNMYTCRQNNIHTETTWKLKMLFRTVQINYVIHQSNQMYKTIKCIEMKKPWNMRVNTKDKSQQGKVDIGPSHMDLTNTKWKTKLLNQEGNVALLVTGNFESVKLLEMQPNIVHTCQSII